MREHRVMEIKLEELKMLPREGRIRRPTRLPLMMQQPQLISRYETLFRNQQRTILSEIKRFLEKSRGF